MIRHFLPPDRPEVLRLWNTAGAAMGYAPLDDKKLDHLLLSHPAFSPELTFVLEDRGMVLGFVNGCVQEDQGFVSCLLLTAQADTREYTAQLLAALEEAFRAWGARCSRVSFFNPIRLPWLIPGTDGHQHNNVPGAAVDWLLHGRLRDLGYRATSRECGMYLNLKDFRMPAWVEEKAGRMAAEGYTVAPYDAARHSGLEQMLEKLQNPLWPSEIPMAVREGRDVLVALWGDTVAGFAGPIYPEETGRGYFAGIGVAPRYERHGLGTLLFYRLCRREKENGARYLSLFTGEENPARRIYEGAGFRVVKTFDVMYKDLTE